MKESNFIFDSVQLLHYKCHKANFKRGESYIESSNRTKNKKAKLNPKNEDDKCFQYAATAVLNHAEIKTDPQRI